MADLVGNKKTTLPSDEVIVRAVQFFSTERWKTTSQSPRSVTFEGKPPFPWLAILFTIAGLALCDVPGLIMYFLFVRKMYRFYNLVITVSPTEGGTAVTISHPGFASSLVKRFLGALPAIPKPA